MEAAKAENPKVVPSTELPLHGPPVLIQGFLRTERRKNSVPAKAKAKLTPRITPPRDVAPMTDVPVIPPLSQPTSSTSNTPHETKKSRSPTPSQLSLPEQERPASWDNAAVYAPSPPKTFQPYIAP